jgi:hypothetical protein
MYRSKFNVLWRSIMMDDAKFAMIQAELNREFGTGDSGVLGWLKKRLFRK